MTQVVEGNTLSFSEGAVTDLEILCYYAYSELYVGDPVARATLLAKCSGVPGATIDILSAFREVSVSAQALSDFQEQKKNTTDTLDFNETLSASASLSSGGTSAQSASSGNQQSTLSTDGYGNLIDVSAAGSGTLSYSMINGNPSGFDYARASSGARVETDYQVSDDTVHMECELNYDASLSLPTAVTFSLKVGSQTKSVTFNTTGSFNGSLSLSGDQPPGIHDLRAGIILSTSFNGMPGSAGSMSWDMKLTLTP